MKPKIYFMMVWQRLAQSARLNQSDAPQLEEESRLNALIQENLAKVEISA